MLEIGKGVGSFCNERMRFEKYTYIHKLSKNII